MERRGGVGGGGVREGNAEGVRGDVGSVGWKRERSESGGSGGVGEGWGGRGRERPEDRK